MIIQRWMQLTEGKVGQTMGVSRVCVLSSYMYVHVKLDSVIRVSRSRIRVCVHARALHVFEIEIDSDTEVRGESQMLRLYSMRGACTRNVYMYIRWQVWAEWIMMCVTDGLGTS